jgi:protein-arginine kinase activator protein McsA
MARNAAKHCFRCEEELADLVFTYIKGKKCTVCEECLEEVQNEIEIEDEAQRVVAEMMEYSL